MILKCLLVREARLNGYNALSFQLYDSLEKAKLQRQAEDEGTRESLNDKA